MINEAFKKSLSAIPVKTNEIYYINNVAIFPSGPSNSVKPALKMLDDIGKIERGIFKNT
jgi:hypothetical protein